MSPARDRQYIFVIGAPRSGTSWLTRMIAEHPQVASLDAELTVFSRYLAPAVDGFDKETGHLERGEWRQGLPLLFGKDEFDEGMRTLIHRVYERVLEKRPAATHILDKHPAYCLHLPLIERMMPGCKYIHIVRDGREVAVSMISANKRVGFGAADIAGAAREWHGHVTQAMAHGGLIGPRRFLEVRYEELRRDPVQGLARVFAFCDLAMDEASIHRIAEEYRIERKQVSSGDRTLGVLRDRPGAIAMDRLTLEERYLFDRMAGALMVRLGHASPGWWASGILDRLRMIPYPFVTRIRRSVRALLHIWLKPITRPL